LQCFDMLPKFERGLVSTKTDDADPVSLRREPLSKKPRSGRHQVGMVGVVLLRMPENLPALNEC
jgi:hypothetical protein